MVYTVVLNASYEIKSCLLLNDFIFSCCFHVFLNNFFVPRVDVNKEGMGGPNCYRRIGVKRSTMILDGSPNPLVPGVH